MGRRKFAKNAEDVRHFRLVARSQNDAYAENPDAPPLVLEPCVRPGDQRRTGLSEAELMQIPESLAAKHPEVFADPDAPPRDPNEDVRHLRADSEELDEDDLEGDCYFPKDGYNYEQHLKRVSGTGKNGGGVVGVVLNAPQQVPEEEINLQPASNIDEVEVLRALEMADEYDEMEDGSLEELIPGGIVDPSLVLWGPTAAEDSDLPDLAAFKAMHLARLGGLHEGEDEDEDEDGGSDDDDEDGQQVAGSSRRRAGAGTAAEAAAAAAEFDEFFAAEYGEEDDIGACDDEEIEGHISLDKCEEVLDEYLDHKKRDFAKLTSLYEPQRGRLDDVPRVIEETKAIIERHYNNEGDDDDESDTDSGEASDSESRTWDCESVLSTLSNVSNRPGKIGKIKVIKKPTQAMKPVKEENENSEDEADDVVELPDVVTERPKNETPEEKKQRKAAVKEMRRICRKMKKESKETYKNETAKLADSKVGTGDIRHKSRAFRL
mmetsp:Transcript_119759/g.298757  ORF Transcript_119759/g.298757 Transcript_119759/m.298757 type:complete len:491 (-) Transcript_119759:245-1717(-)